MQAEAVHGGGEDTQGPLPGLVPVGTLVLIKEDVGPLHTVKVSYGWKGHHSLKTETKKREAMFWG